MGKSFKNLVLWKKAHGLVLGVYKLSSQLPDSEKFGLINQIQRSCVSVPANIVEGFGRISPKEKLRFLYIANGSLEETRYFLILIQDLNFSITESLQEELSEVSKILNTYIKKLRASLQ
ncbi:four helix bundle protein [Pseudotenacibaculum sp. MALMAid0570]|uniref:four helix bundle protein n=1 Tax=Pseudotenacibaculum sp. MALMAid0570 TaxID=3143938 RepID=UPI0032E04F3D